jgi:hypothetical protein
MSVSIAFESNAWLPTGERIRNVFFMKLSAEFFHTFQINEDGHDKTVNVRDFFVSYSTTPPNPSCLPTLPKSDPLAR